MNRFVKALRADVVIEKLERPGGLGVPAILASRDWFARRQRTQARARAMDAYRGCEIDMHELKRRLDAIDAG